MVVEKRKKVLIVDDEETILLTMNRHVLNAGFDPILAHSAKDALEKIEQETPDLIFLDVMMPEVNGFAFCRTLREKEKTRNIPIIIATALKSEADSSAAQLSGATEVLVKPLKATDVSARLRRYLGSPFKS